MAIEIEGVSHLNTGELKALLNDPAKKDLLVIDVRELEEYEESHIPGIPLIPMSEMMDVMDRFDEDQEYVFICRSGRRSLEVSKYFQSENFTKVHNYKGGMLDWDGELATGPEKVVGEFTIDDLRRS